MKSVFIKNMLMVLSIVLVISMLGGCGSREAANADAAAAAEQTPVAASPVITLIAGERQITIEDTAGKTVQQLLDQARITLDEGELLVISPEQVLGGTEIVISVKEAAEEPAPKPTEPEPTEPETTEPEPTEPAPTEPENTEKTVVSVEVYEDCDGSGHGVKVIKYSDGTQEEVYF